MIRNKNDINIKEQRVLFWEKNNKLQKDEVEYYYE